MTDLPRASTAALLLTDVVDSTKLSEALGDDRMAALWAAHDRAARDLLGPHGGREIDKTDGFLHLFSTAAQALAYAQAYHRALAQLDPPMSARAGIHHGPVILTENQPEDVARGAKPLEVDGRTKPVAGEVMSLAGAGQTLITASAAEHLSDVETRSVGHWRFRGLADPIELFEVADGDSSDPPADRTRAYRVRQNQGGVWIPVRAVPHSLRAERDAFVGRESDLLALRESLDSGARLVSVLGIGGTGKTRLVTRFGWSHLGEWDGVWFCDLSEARTPEGIAHAVARAFQLPLVEGDPMTELGSAIRDRGRSLVILDNFEQVARHAADTIGRWLDQAPKTAFVATTREVLGLPGEQALAIAPLSDEDGVALFLTRARQARRDFDPDPDDPDILALVRLLDRLPLAIELAAARVRLMPPSTLLNRMGQRFRLLAASGARRDRQSTLRATLDWSWELLDPAEQAALAQLSVFEGGFSLEAAEAVLDLDAHEDAPWPMDAVQALVDKSLVQRVDDERFDLLVSVQEYAAAKLGELGGGPEVELRHLHRFAAFGTDEAMGRSAESASSVPMGVMELEIDNLARACSRGVALGEGAAATSALRAAWRFLHSRGPFPVGERLAREVLALPELSGPDRVRAFRVLSSALRSQGRGPEGWQALEQALAGTRATGDRAAEGQVLQAMGHADDKNGRPAAAKTRLTAAIAIAQEHGLAADEVRALSTLGQVHVHQGEPDEARQTLARANEIAIGLGHRGLIATTQLTLGNLFVAQGDAEQAVKHLQRALAIALEVGDRRFAANVRNDLASALVDARRFDEIGDTLKASLEVDREVGDRRSEGVTLGNLAAWYGESGDMVTARALLMQALTLLRSVNDPRQLGHTLSNVAFLNQLEGRTEEALAHYREAVEILQAAGDRRQVAFVLDNLGGFYLELDRVDDAAAAYADSLEGATAVGDRVLQGVLHGSLGALETRRGRTDQAAAHFEAGLTQLRQAGSAASLGVLLCRQGELLVQLGDRPGAEACLEEAKAMMDELSATPESDLGRRVDRLAALMAERLQE